MFSLGRIGFIPGTFGSLATVIFLFICFHILNISPNIILLILILAFAYSFIAIKIIQKIMIIKTQEKLLLMNSLVNQFQFIFMKYLMALKNI